MRRTQQCVTYYGNKQVNEQLNSMTSYDTHGFFSAARAVFTTSPAAMASDKKEIDRLQTELEKLLQPVNKTTWDEVTDSWMAR